MKLFNQTKNTTITLNLKVAKSLKEKSIGLLKEEKPTALLFSTRWGIHTFGMKFAIDIIILDNENRVKILKQNLQPNRFFFWNPIFKTVIELPPHSLSDSKTEINDIIQSK